MAKLLVFGVADMVRIGCLVASSFCRYPWCCVESDSIMDSVIWRFSTGISSVINSGALDDSSSPPLVKVSASSSLSSPSVLSSSSYDSSSCFSRGSSCSLSS